MIENATIEDLQHELNAMAQDSIADLGLEEDVDEGTVTADLFSSMTWMYDYPAEQLAEVARREFGFCPHDARPDVLEAFTKLLEEW
jgi:hypothetical protein